MSLEYAILGFLNYSPLSGYDLKKVFDVSVKHFWLADQSQIYRTLSRLMDEGWVKMEIVEQTERPDRKVYQITTDGRAELLCWLASSVPMPENRSASLIQVFFAAQLSDKEILAIFERAAEQLKVTLGQYDAISQENEKYQEYTASPRELYFWMLTLEAGKVTAEANLELVESVLHRIRNKELPQA